MKNKKIECICDTVGIKPADIPIIVGGIPRSKFISVKSLLSIAKTAEIACFRCGKLNSLSKMLTSDKFTTWRGIQCSCGASFLAHMKHYVRKEDVGIKCDKWGRTIKKGARK